VGHEPGRVALLNRVSRSHSKRLTTEELAVVSSELGESDDQEDRDIARVLGRRQLTDDERERVRRLLAHRMLKYRLLPDGSLSSEGRAIDAIIGKLMFY
jgi:hypothetical protein